VADVVDSVLTGKRRLILEFIAEQIRSRGYPPSVREIGEAVGLTSSSTVHAHLQVLQRQGYLRRDPSKPRAIVVSFEPASGAAIPLRPVAHVPLLGNVAAGTGVLAEENVEEMLPLPEDFTGSGQLFMLRVRGESMIGAGVLDGDYVVVRRQPTAEQGDMVVAGIPGGEATVKTFRRSGRQVVLVASNPAFADIELPEQDVVIYGKVVTVLRRL
jgi:repressor LexA